MKITILNSNPDAASQTFDRYLAELSNELSSSGHNVAILPLRELDIKFCTGCFGCWIETPGECVVKDDSASVCRQMINSDLVLWASPIIMGFPSALLKKMVDKSICLIHPYFSIVKGEYHHKARYNHYPLCGVIWEMSGNTENRDIQIVNDIFNRTALNFKSQLVLTSTTVDPVKEVADEINRL
ncbi:MAG: flavodoxin family protein [Anaerolineales bacterium]|nr:flavodoxin family protein [Anaerolineales bacterium]